MDEDYSNNRIKKVTAQFRTMMEHITPPGPHVVTPFMSIHEWLNFQCQHEQRFEPVSEYMIVFSEPPNVLASLVGYNHGIENGVPVSRIVFQPQQFTWFELPVDKYGSLTRAQLIDIVHSELKEFFTTEQFKKSFLARGYNISTNFEEDIWSL